MAAGLALAGIGVGLTMRPVGRPSSTASANKTGDGVVARHHPSPDRHEVSMSSMMAYGLRRTTISAGNARPRRCIGFGKTARVALDAVTKITSEIALISLPGPAMALGWRYCCDGRHPLTRRAHY